MDRFHLDSDGERIAVVHVPPAAARADGRPLTAVALHGAGDSHQGLLTGLLEDFAARGCRALSLDFSGHGASTGRLADLSLLRRLRQAADLVEQRAGDDPLMLVGFSMSGQTVADLVARYGDRVRAIGLCAPAVYAADAWELPFAGGFTEVVRRPGSWHGSPALDSLRAFTGRSVLAVPGRDEVIPPAVTEAVARALAERSAFSRLELPAAEHRLGRWFGSHPGERRRLVAALVDPDTGDGPGTGDGRAAG